ncbi:hypothetical protein MCERE19_01587 [Spirosomataceae bacterium]
MSTYINMKASTYDPMKRQSIVAYSTTNIIVFNGLERLRCMPRMILEIKIENDVLVYTRRLILLAATQEKPKLLQKLKGKK